MIFENLDPRPARRRYPNVYASGGKLYKLGTLLERGERVLESVGVGNVSAFPLDPCSAFDEGAEIGPPLPVIILDGPRAFRFVLLAELVELVLRCSVPAEEVALVMSDETL